MVGYIYIEDMGSCPGRALDARKFEKYFLSNGFKISKNPKGANYVLFITCAYKTNIEDIAIKRIRELSKYKAKLIVGGCLKRINEERLNENFSGESFVTSNNEYIDRLFPDFKIKFKDLPDANILYPERIFRKFKRVCSSRLNLKLCLSFFKRVMIYIREKTSFFKAYYIRICWGCINTHCTYCVIWRAIGKLRSKSIKTCLEEFNNALKKGYKRIILVGENVGAYGLDINHTLPDLLNRFLAVDGNYEIQLECLNPMWIVKYIDELIPNIKLGKIKVVDCTIQSGNSRILKLMNRGYDAYQLKGALFKLKTAYPNLKFHTHIIIGFPSETEEDFEDTLNIVKEIGFELVQIFPYCKNTNMPVEYLKQELPPEVIRARSKKATEFFRKYGIAYLID